MSFKRQLQMLGFIRPVMVSDMLPTDFSPLPPILAEWHQSFVQILWWSFCECW